MLLTLYRRKNFCMKKILRNARSSIVIYMEHRLHQKHIYTMYIYIHVYQMMSLRCDQVGTPGASLFFLQNGGGGGGSVGGGGGSCSCYVYVQDKMTNGGGGGGVGTASLKVGIRITAKLLLSSHSIFFTP